MKDIPRFALALGAGAVLGWFFLEVPAQAQGGQGHGAGALAVENGDVNGESGIDISDAIYLLSWLFLGGPALVPCSTEQGQPSGLPDTGQSICYDQSGAVINCTSATCPGQDGFYATGCASAGRFLDNSDGTVTDTCTGLMWQKLTADTNGDGQSTDRDFLGWCAALSYCENLSFAGHNDWRLPNVRELQSIVDYGRVSPSIAPVFGAFLVWGYWSSTTTSCVPRTTVCNYDPDAVWHITFIGGLVVVTLKNSPGHIRAVRSGPI